MKITVEQAQADPSASQRGPHELQRVEQSIQAIVLAFCRERLFDTFHMEDLYAYVTKRTAIAPDSAGRVLRDLRKRERVGYDLVNRRESEYVVRWVI
jgi:hypothetical protein